MLVPKPRHVFSLAVMGVLFVLPLASCDSGSVGGTPPGASGAFTSAGAHASAGAAGALSAGSSGAPAITLGGGGGAPPTPAGGNPATGGVDGLSGGGGTGGMAPPPCTDVQHPDHVKDGDCSIWPDWDATKGANEPKDCDASWLTGVGYCLKSCGKCKDPNGSGGSGGSGGMGVFSTGLGPGPKLPDVPTSNKVMWASRYWDCCKPHCSTNGNIKSCGADGVSQNGGGSACSGGSAYTCYSQAPRAIGDYVAYGYVAVPNPQCGTCYHLQFTGTGQFAANDPGSKQLLGKHMIVKVSNTGGDVAGNQFDMMIPGGGVGQNANTCPNQWKVSASDLGPTQGGFLTGCTGSYSAKRDCVRQKCMLLPDGDLRKGCIWFVDWYAAADNPQFRYESIQCPSDI
ncbi:MAG TPA: hypothetical protein VFK05_13990 [Polyangiaceae bacterium]|nr:hypothetical protein [Polyangiaceae bacterium]